MSTAGDPRSFAVGLDVAACEVAPIRGHEPTNRFAARLETHATSPATVFIGHAAHVLRCPLPSRNSCRMLGLRIETRAHKDGNESDLTRRRPGRIRSPGWRKAAPVMEGDRRLSRSRAPHRPPMGENTGLPVRRHGDSSRASVYAYSVNSTLGVHRANLRPPANRPRPCGSARRLYSPWRPWH